MTIPKIIHYCWFGGKPLPKLAVKCKRSWEKYFVDYEIKEWNEGNFDVYEHEYTKYCYEHNLWAYLSDFVRLAVVEREGGLYFDTDVEVVRFPKEILDSCSAFFGLETPDYIASGLGFAAIPHHPAIKEMLNLYDGLVQNGIYMFEHMQGCPKLNTAALVPYGFKCDGSKQFVCDALILPMEYLCPFNDVTGELKKTDNTISIHWFSKSPHGKWEKWKTKITRPLHRWLGVDFFRINN
ncbi:MAG: glycosyl transferase [Prevotellaceae bacterium]|nr:glycosyl transferase [Prevotellaceae bacterium]